MNTTNKENSKYKDKSKYCGMSYGGLHRWLKDNFKKETECDFCHKEKDRIEWALKKGREYSRNSYDYFNLCVSCHRKYDYNKEKNMEKDIEKGIKLGRSRVKPIKEVDSDGNIISEWPSLKSAAREFNICRPYLSYHLARKKGYETVKGRIFIYA